LALLLGLVFVPATVQSADKTSRPLDVISIGHVARVDDRSATTWGMSGFEMIRINLSAAGHTPIMRTLALDARTVEILSRTQAPPLRTRDVRVVRESGRELIAVRGYFLMEVTPADARAEKMTTNALARKWAAAIGIVLPQVAPMPSAFGV